MPVWYKSRVSTLRELVVPQRLHWYILLGFVSTDVAMGRAVLLRELVARHNMAAAMAATGPRSGGRAELTFARRA
jgi:hypothetical protein